MSRFKALLQALPSEVQDALNKRLDETKIETGMTPGKVEDLLLEVQKSVIAEVQEQGLVLPHDLPMVLALLSFFATAGVEAIFAADDK